MSIKFLVTINFNKCFFIKLVCLILIRDWNGIFYVKEKAYKGKGLKWVYYLGVMGSLYKGNIGFRNLISIITNSCGKRGPSIKTQL